MKKVYISHPLRGDTDRDVPNYRILFNNMKRIDKVCRYITRYYSDVLPLSPVNAFSFFEPFFDDDKALEMCLKLIELADEMWVFGDWKTSEGCRKEIERARELGIPVNFLTYRFTTVEDTADEG
jgi:hypothetical protein